MLVACLYEEDGIVFHDLETSEHKVVEVEWPLKCAASHCNVIASTQEDGLHLFTRDGELIQVVPDSNDVFCAAFHPSNPCILAIGFKDGAVGIWDVKTRTQSQLSKFQEHQDYICP